jgi:hypothetical protein
VIGRKPRHRDCEVKSEVEMYTTISRSLTTTTTGETRTQNKLGQSLVLGWANRFQLAIFARTYVETEPPLLPEVLVQPPPSRYVIYVFRISAMRAHENEFWCPKNWQKERGRCLFVRQPNHLVSTMMSSTTPFPSAWNAIIFQGPPSHEKD